MSIEQFKEESPFSEGDIETARDLLKEDDLLSKDPYAISVVESGGYISERGSYVSDLGDFLHARRAFLEGEEGKEKLAAFNPELVEVVTSVRPDLEEK